MIIETLTTTEAIRKRSGLYFDLLDPLLPSKLIAQCFCLAPDGASLQVSPYGEGEARLVYHPLSEGLLRFVQGKPWAASCLSDIMVPGHPKAVLGGGWATVIACCSRFDILVRDEKAEWGQRFENGEPTTEFEILDVGGLPSVLIDLELDESFLPNTRLDLKWIAEWGVAAGFSWGTQVI